MRILTAIFILVIFGCEPKWDFYENYLILKGSHSSVFRMESLQSNSLTFWAIFDESAIYECVDPVNQWDVNKLYGFSDCNSHHHQNSARFGWRWMDDNLEIFAYCYVNGERIIQPLGTAPLNEASYYELELTSEAYVFHFNGQTQSIARGSNCNAGIYYMLYPYFGGDEVAPHDIKIRIKREY